MWHAGLSQINSADIERVQRAACSVILGKQYNSYQTALSIIGLVRLDTRREQLSSKFARKALKSKKYASWFVKTPIYLIQEERSKMSKKPIVEQKDYKNLPSPTSLTF